MTHSDDIFRNQAISQVIISRDYVYMHLKKKNTNPRMWRRLFLWGRGGEVWKHAPRKCFEKYTEKRILATYLHKIKELWNLTGDH